MATGDLVTLAELKDRMETTETAADALLSALISSASAAIATHTGREFAGPATAETRPIAPAESWGELGLRVGDLRSLTVGAGAVRILNADGVETAALASTDFVLEPVGRPSSRPAERIRPKSTVTNATLSSGYSITVAGLWGWPTVPADVKEACIRTVLSWHRADGERFAGGAGFGVSESTMFAPTPAPVWMLPMAAKQLLTNYRRRGVA